MLVKATTFSFIVFFPTYLYNIGNGMTFFFFCERGRKLFDLPGRRVGRSSRQVGPTECRTSSVTDKHTA